MKASSSNNQQGRFVANLCRLWKDPQDHALPGAEVQDVNKLIKQIREAQKLMKTIRETGGRGLEICLGN